MIKFTDALRLGAMLGQQIFEGEINPVDNSSCAFGAAVLGAGLPVEPPRGGMFLRGGTASIGTVTLPVEWRQLLAMDAPCPACDRFLDPIILQIAHLNDTHRWTRQQIADWVAPFEEALAAPTATLIEQKQEVSE